MKKRNACKTCIYTKYLCVETEKSCDNTRWFKYDRDDLCVKKSQFVPVIFEPSCMSAQVSGCRNGSGRPHYKVNMSATVQ